MTTIYRVRDDVRYVEVPCSVCHVNSVVSEDAMEFYTMSAPFQPYLCPTCRRRRYPDAALYGEISQVERERQR